MLSAAAIFSLSIFHSAGFQTEIHTWSPVLGTCCHEVVQFLLARGQWICHKCIVRFQRSERILRKGTASSSEGCQINSEPRYQSFAATAMDPGDFLSNFEAEIMEEFFFSNLKAQVTEHWEAACAEHASIAEHIHNKNLPALLTYDKEDPHGILSLAPASRRHRKNCAAC
eukprot:s691_g11.t1